MKVYVLPKSETKNCPTCKSKTEKEILIVTYNNNGSLIQNHLFTRRCFECNKTYIAESIFKTYTKNKNIDNINVDFILKDTN